MIKKLKTQNSKLRFCHLSFVLWNCFVICALSFVISSAYAKEITILYTGETHAMLYPCNCPLEPDGGVARRATLVKQLKKENPYTLLLDSGGFFAGGLLDEYTQNTQLDMQRTIINLESMEIMGYDGVAIGDDEFNFGRDFFIENITKIKIPFLSCNIKDGNLLPYSIKEIAGTKIGMIAVTPLSAAQKAGGLKFDEPKMAVELAQEELKKKGADIILLLSHLGENDDAKLAQEIEGIDIIITGHHRRSKESPLEKIGPTLILRPAWQGRKLGKLSLTVTDNKITDYKVEELRLSDRINDDPQILSILPRCFNDNDCRKDGQLGKCQDAGSLNARCVFAEPVKISLLIIRPKACISCNPETVISFLKKSFAGLNVSYLYYPDIKTNKLIRDFGIRALPVYLLGREIEKEKAFDSVKEHLDLKGDFYMLKPQFAGFSYFLNRKKQKGKIDLFLSLYDKNTPELLRIMKRYSPALHFLAVETSGRFDAAQGSLEAEDYLRAVCVQKYYPEYFWEYISCRAKNIGSSWWEDCATRLDTDKIKTCSRGQEGPILLRENIALNRELEIMFGPTYLLDNQEIFGLRGVPTEEELQKIFKEYGGIR